MKFAPGTPESVMRDREEKFYGNKNKRDATAPPPKMTSAMLEQMDKADKAKAAMAKAEQMNSKKPLPAPTLSPVMPKPQPKTIVDPVRPMPVTGVKPITGGMSQTPRPTTGPAPAPMATPVTIRGRVNPMGGNPTGGMNQAPAMKKGGAVQKPAKYASSGSVSSASKRADGIATKGKTKGRMC